jgi:NAD(P)-dependent dehydrogenase (short-subunit alcohol dehydrogenase family)
MRGQHSGLVVAISSTAGIVGQEFCSAYAAAKFGEEGWMESLTPEVAPFGIRTMLAEALLQVAGQDQPPLRFPAGADAVAAFGQKAKVLFDQADAYHKLSSSLARDDA